MALAALWGWFNVVYSDMDHCHLVLSSFSHSMSDNLSLGNNKSNFSFVRALVFSPGKPGSNWFKATVGDSLVMVFYPDDASITAEMIQPGDTLFIAGVKDMEVKGSCDKKANCAPFALQIDAFKNAVRYRQQNIEAELLIEKAVESQPKEEPKDSEFFEVFIDQSMKFSGLVRGKENVDFVKAKKEKYSARGRHRSMYAINEIIELARRGEAK